jgi:transposase
MYRILFGVGVLTACFAIYKGFSASNPSQIVPSLVFAGLSAASFFTLTIVRPLDSLERNTIFSSWIIGLTNTYWTRIALIDDLQKQQDELKQANDDLLSCAKRAKHDTLGGMKQEKQILEWKEGRRRRAWELQEQGWKQKDIATALGVSKGAVSQWLTRARTQGVEALRRHPAPGRQAKISPEQLALVPAILAKGAEAFGFRGQVWTTGRVAVVMKRELGVSYHPTHWSRLLRTLKHSVQKPGQRASQRDEVAIKRWKDEGWPALKKKPSRKSASSSL